MIRYAWRTLLSDPVRLAVTVVGVTFAVALVLTQAGIYSGFMHSSSAVIEHSPGDLWVMTRKTVNTDSARPFSEAWIHEVREVPGVAWAAPMIHAWAYLKLPDGAGLWGQVIGFDPVTGIGGPWEMRDGTVGALKKPGTYIVDEASLPQLRGVGVGDRLENFEQKIEVVGVCRGAKSYTTYPVLFTSYRTAQAQSLKLDNRLTFVVVGLAPGADRGEAIERLSGLRNLEVRTREDFMGDVRGYWSSRTGIGIGIGVSILLGIIVGIVIVGQTMYAATLERMQEYSTLKAIGASVRQICAAIWAQALVVALAGYVLGATLAVLVERSYAGQVISMKMTPGLFVAAFAGDVVMCLAASMLSVMRVVRLDPAQLFRHA